MDGQTHNPSTPENRPSADFTHSQNLDSIRAKIAGLTAPFETQDQHNDRASIELNLDPAYERGHAVRTQNGEQHVHTPEQASASPEIGIADAISETIQKVQSIQRSHVEQLGRKGALLPLKKARNFVEKTNEERMLDTQARIGGSIFTANSAPLPAGNSYKFFVKDDVVYFVKEMNGTSSVTTYWVSDGMVYKQHPEVDHHEQVSRTESVRLYDALYWLGILFAEKDTKLTVRDVYPEHHQNRYTFAA